MEDNMVLPSHILIGTVEGICNNRCNMCPIKDSIRKGIMNNEIFSKILSKLQPYLSGQHFLSFCGSINLSQYQDEPAHWGMVLVSRLAGPPQ